MHLEEVLEAIVSLSVYNLGFGTLGAASSLALNTAQAHIF